MGMVLAFVAGLFIPLSNLCVKKGVDERGNAKVFFLFQMIFSCLFATFFGPIRAGDFSIPLQTAGLGSIAGLILAWMLYSLGRSLEKGPPGLSFAVLNSATVMPGLIMALLFGPLYGFEYNFWHAVGSIFVLVGLFWGAQGLQGMKEMKSWLFFSSLMFLFHTLLLALYQWKGMLTNHPQPEMISLFSKEAVQSDWFAPFMFLSCGLVQGLIYFRASIGSPRRVEVFYSMAGGMSSFLCTYFIMWATQVATPLENAVIFPIYSVIGIILTNLWGEKLYQEVVNWRACQICVFGLIVGTVNWKTVAAWIGL